MTDDRATAPGDGLRLAYKAAARSVAEAAEPGAAFAAATGLVHAADEVVGEAAVLRAAMALRIMQEERLSLSQLAERIGTSKSRADQLIRIARERAKESG